MRVRIGICLLALCWPLLVTAAPAFVSSAPTHACCRREGAHHCQSPAPHESTTTVAAVCPQSGKRLKFAGAKSGRPVVLVPIARSQSDDAVAPHMASKALLSDVRVLPARAPPLA
jgi:hypothetical protein